MPQLDFTIFSTQIFWLIIAFLMVYAFVAKFFLPRMGEVVEGRRNKIQEDIQTAEQAIEEYKGLIAKKDKELEAAKHKAFEIVAKTAKETHKTIEDKLEKAEEDINRMAVKEEEKLARLKVQLEAGIAEIAQAMSSEIAKKMVESFSIKVKN